MQEAQEDAPRKPADGPIEMDNIQKWLWVKTNGIPFWGIGAPLILEPVFVGIGMFTGGTIWILTHGKIGGF